MSSRRKSADATPEKKPSRWRFGRRRSASRTECSSSARTPEVASPTPQQFYQNPLASPVPPMPPSRATPTSIREEPDFKLRELVRSLSLKDDPTQFGMNTLAARRMQREELDAAMARSLFSRELAEMPQPSQPPSSPVQPPPGNPFQRVSIDLRPLMHLRPAFSEREWAQFTEDPLKYIRTRGLPQEVHVEEVRPNTSPPPTLQLEGSEHFILPPGFPRPPPAASPAPSTSPSPSPAARKGLSTEEMTRVLTTFNHQDTGRQAESKKRPSRIRGRRMPKGANTQGILSDQEANECSICLVDFEAGQRVGLLPCCHRFHAECVTVWLQREASCPECREDLKPHLH